MMASSNPAAAARYTPGSWLGVVRSGTVVLLRPDSAPALVDSLWELLAAGPEVHEVLDAVTRPRAVRSPGCPGSRSWPANGSTQVFLRGEIDLTVDLPAGPVELSGRDVTTWTERRFAKAAGFSLTVPGAAAAGASAASGLLLDLPVADGVVLLQGPAREASTVPPGTGAPPPAVPAAATAAAVAADLLPSISLPWISAPDAEAAVEDEVLAAAEADIAAALSDHGASAETVLEFPGEDSERDGTLHEEPEPEPEPEPPLEPRTTVEPVPEPAEQELTSSYDHLWEQTVMRNIEDAAVREDPDADSEPAVESAHGESAKDDMPPPSPPVPGQRPGPLR